MALTVKKLAMFLALCALCIGIWISLVFTVFGAAQACEEGETQLPCADLHLVTEGLPARITVWAYIDRNGDLQFTTPEVELFDAWSHRRDGIATMSLPNRIKEKLW